MRKSRMLAAVLVLPLLLATPIAARAVQTGDGAQAVAQTAKSAGETGRLAFEVLRDGSPIGTHVIAFDHGEAGDLSVAIAIDLEVGLGPITLYRYTHRNRVAWQGERLVRLRAETDDDGTPHRVAVDGAVAGGEAVIRVANDGEEAQRPLPPAGAPGGPAVLPSTYWSRATVDQTRLLNTQTGEIEDVTVTRMGRERVATPEGERMATRYRVDGDLKLDLWYDDDDRLVSLAFEARGSQITYRLREASGTVVSRAPSMRQAHGS